MTGTAWVTGSCDGSLAQSNSHTCIYFNSIYTRRYLTSTAWVMEPFDRTQAQSNCHTCVCFSFMHTCRYVTGTAWVTGSCDGSLALWTQLKKKPAFTVARAHALPPDQLADEAVESTPGADPRSWVQSVAVCPGSDFVVRTLMHQADNGDPETGLGMSG